jgi:hypothetical protein
LILLILSPVLMLIFSLILVALGLEGPEWLTFLNSHL